MLRDLLTQKSVDQKTVTDFRYPRACRFRKYQIENRLWELPLPTFFKTWFKFIKCRAMAVCTFIDSTIFSRWRRCKLLKAPPSVKDYTNLLFIGIKNTEHWPSIKPWLNVAKIGQNWPKLTKIDRFSNFLWLFSRFSGRGTHQRNS
jgi:hypothetical protein